MAATSVTFQRTRFLDHKDREDIANHSNRRKVMRDKTAVAEHSFRQPCHNQNERRQPKSDADLTLVHLGLPAERWKTRLAVILTL
jgi:hypothetical protein